MSGFEQSSALGWFFNDLYFYNERNIGRPRLCPRMVLGALIIKHQENLDDSRVIASIQENVYMQFFVELKGFSAKPIIDPSLFVEIRKRVGASTFDALNKKLIQSISKEVDEKQNSKKKKDNYWPPNKGHLQMDATVADQYITYPTDSKLLNESRKKCKKMIDKRYELSGKKDKKPRTYRRELDTVFLNYAKKKNKSKSVHRKMNRKLLEGLKRDIGHLNKLLDSFRDSNAGFPLTYQVQRMLWIVNTQYFQLLILLSQKTNYQDL
jgi:IS5 family transposase